MGSSVFDAPALRRSGVAAPEAGTTATVWPVAPASNGTYPVTVYPVGLPSALQWSVVVDGGSPLDAFGNGNITAWLPNGTYSLGLAGSALWIPVPANLTASVNGSGEELAAVFTEEYYLNFTQSGLPTGNRSVWHVFLQYLERSANANQTIQYEEPNGSYQVSAGSSLPYIPVPQTETISVDGPPPTFSFTFFPPATLFNVTFEAVGLPTSESWSVSVDGRGGGVAVSPSLYLFHEPNGTHVYAASSSDGYQAVPGAATFVVNGSNLTVPIRFATPMEYSVSFDAVGQGAQAWQIELTPSGPYSNATGGPIVARVANGSYTYNVTPLNGLSPFPANGTVVVAGANVSVAITFIAHAGNLTFSELGLPAGTWWIAINGTNHTLPAGASLTLTLPFGLYSYDSGASNSSFIDSVPQGQAIIGADPQLVTLTFLVLPGPPPAPATASSLTSTLRGHLVEVAAVVVVVVAILGVLLWRRYRDPPPAPAHRSETGGAKR